MRRRLGKQVSNAADLLVACKQELWPTVEDLVTKVNELIAGHNNGDSISVANVGEGVPLLGKDGQVISAPALVAGTGVTLTTLEDGGLEVASSATVTTYRVTTVSWCDRAGSGLTFYVPWGLTVEDVSITNDASRIAFHADGRLLNVVLIANSNLSDTDVGFHVDENTTPEVDLTQSVATDTPEVFDFSGSPAAVFTAGQLLHISIDPTSGANELNIICTWELDL